MEREHRKYLIISGIAYLLFCIITEIYTYKMGSSNPLISPCHNVYFHYFKIIILIFAFIFGIRNSVRAIVIWLGIICGEFFSNLDRVYFSLNKILELVDAFGAINFALIIIAIVFGFKSLNMNTIASDGFSKVYRKSAIILFLFMGLYSFFMAITAFELFWFAEYIMILKIFFVFSVLLDYSIYFCALIVAVYNICKRKTFGYVLSAIFLIWEFSSSMSYLLCEVSFTLPDTVMQNDVIRNDLLLSLPPKFLNLFEPYMFVLVLVFSYILLVNFLLHLERDPELIPKKNK